MIIYNLIHGPTPLVISRRMYELAKEKWPDMKDVEYVPGFGWCELVVSDGPTEPVKSEKDGEA